MFNPDLSALAGGAQTGFTSPTYDSTVDVAPDSNGKQYAVTAIGGTQASVRTHSVSDPFTATFVRPKTLKSLPNANPVSGLRGTVPRNTYLIIIRKGVNVAANLSPVPMVIRSAIDVPAGADSYDAPNVKAALSYFAGLIADQSAGIGDTALSGIM
jgi:hypothetical protein